MSSLTEKVLMIGFGATICLSLFSMISPLLNNLLANNSNLNDNRDILKYYEMITEIKRKSEDAVQFFGEDFRIDYTFSSAKEIQFSKTNVTTLLIEMERENQVFIDIIEIKTTFTFWVKITGQHTAFYHYYPGNESDKSIEVKFNLKMVGNDLCFQFLL